MEAQLNIAINVVLNSWNTILGMTIGVLDNVTDEDMMREVSLGRNTGIYLLGHLVAVHDRMLPLLGIGERKYPELDDIFLNTPDRSGKTMPPVQELRAKWLETNNALNTAFSAMQPIDWLSRHTSISEEDFAKQPHRNKLNVLASRTTHLAEHYGQLLFLKPRA
ncbi:MAG: hypothetical protein K0Q79_2572 [Flavipsychrobacter sp.]|jgi:hypothetical protein|nr:hypothetical protein [Flavipsychrobacter sp.]